MERVITTPSILQEQKQLITSSKYPTVTLSQTPSSVREDVPRACSTTQTKEETRTAKTQPDKHHETVCGTLVEQTVTLLHCPLTEAANFVNS